MKGYIPLTVKVLGLMSSVMLALFTIHIYYHYHAEVEEYDESLNRRMELQAKLMASSLAQPMWDFSMSYIHSIVSGSLKDPDIDGMIIWDANGNIIERQGVFPMDDLHFHVYMPLEYKLDSQSQPLGKLMLSVSRANDRNTLSAYLSNLILEYIVLLTLQMTLLYLVLRKMIRPVQSITQAMLQLARGDTLIEIPSQNRKDEIGQMARSIQIFRDTAVRADQLSREIEFSKQLQEELKQAKEDAEAATRLKSEFLANMSHEVRTPMNGVIGMANLLTETPLDEKQKGYTRTILRSAEDLLQIVNDILDFSKIEAGKMMLEDVAFDLKSVIEEVLELMDVKAKEKQLRLELDYADEIPSAVRGDPGRVRQIFINLVSNAIKFTETGYVRVIVTTRNVTPDFANYQVRVEDSGIGIPADKMDYIFNKFTQSDGSTTRKFGGTGLGLAICKWLTRMMGGDIGVESTLGTGSCFWFTIELRQQSPEQRFLASENKPATMKKPVEPLSYAQRQVLLVEDNAVNLQLASLLLTKLGCIVTPAGNGAEALNLLMQRSFDVIFMDCQMPVMDGYEATREIRRRESQSPGSHVPIIALTAHAMKGDDEKCYAAGMDDYLTKPMKRGDIEAMLDKWLTCQLSIQSKNPPFPYIVDSL